MFPGVFYQPPPSRHAEKPACLLIPYSARVPAENYRFAPGEKTRLTHSICQNSPSESPKFVE
jgi:hypothetical protein